VERLFARYKGDGPTGLVSRRRGQRNHVLPDGLREEALSIVRTRYSDFGPTLAHEKLLEVHGLRMSVETLRQYAGGQRPGRARPPDASRPARQRAPAPRYLRDGRRESVLARVHGRLQSTLRTLSAKRALIRIGPCSSATVSTTSLPGRKSGASLRSSPCITSARCTWRLRADIHSGPGACGSSLRGSCLQVNGGRVVIVSRARRGNRRSRERSSACLPDSCSYCSARSRRPSRRRLPG